MSVFKVIGNTYTDLLDHMNVEYRKYNYNLDKYFQQMKGDDKRKLIDKLSYLYQRVETLRMSQDKFWASKRASANFFITLIVIVLLMGFGIMGFFLSFQIKHGGIYLFNEKVRLVLIYTMMYMIFFTVFFLLLRNIMYNKTQSQETQKEIMGNISRFGNLLGLDDEFQTVLKFIAYKNSESVSRYQYLWKKNATLLRPYIKNAPADNSPLTQSHSVDIDGLFAQKHAVLKEKLSTLFNNGDGYLIVKKELVSSTNSMMIKEFRSIIRFYYVLIKRIENPTDLENMEEIRLKTIDTYVVNDLANIPLLMTPVNNNAYINTVDAPMDSSLDVIVKSNTDNALFQKDWKIFKIFLVYTVTYCYQIWIRKSTLDASMPSSLKGKNMMPHLIDMNSVPKEDMDVYQRLQEVFSRHFETTMMNTMKDAKDRKEPSVEAKPPPIIEAQDDSGDNATCLIVPNKSEVTDSDNELAIPTKTSDETFSRLLSSTMTDIMDEFERYYNPVMTKLVGDYWFPFDTTFLLQNLPKFMKDVHSIDPVNDQNYYREFMYAMSSTVIPRCMTAFKSYQAQNGNLPERISPIIARMNIKLKDYSMYIIGRLQDIHGELKPEVKARAIEVIDMIDADVKNKLMTSESTYGKKSNDLRFLDLDSFITKIDDMSYTDLRSGLNHEYFKSILDTFYYAVSNSVNASTGNTKDIYFNEEKRLKLSNQGFVLFVVILSIGVLYHVIGVFDEYKYTGKAKDKYFMDKIDLTGISPEKRKEINNMRFDFMDKKVNLWFKGIIPITAVVFVMCLFWSFLRKSKAKYNFNRETIDSNTASLRASVHELSMLFTDMDTRVKKAEITSTLRNLPQITIDDKTKMYESVKNIIDRFEKCNYILAAQTGDIPFPYTEATIDMFMILLCILCIIYIYGKINPIERMRDLKTLYALKEKGQYLENDKDFTDEVTAKAKCHDTDIDSIVFTIKVLFFLFVIMFLLFYSTKVVQSTSEYEFGIYNSVYFEEALCLD